jgi:hypothetical protein
MLLGGGNDPFFQHVEGVLQNVGDVPCSTRIDHVGIEVKVQPGKMLTKDLQAFAPRISNAFYGIWNNFTADAFHGDGRKHMRNHDVADQSISFVTHHDLSGLRD